MELLVRKGKDVFVPSGSLLRLQAELARYRSDLANIPVVILSCFDRATRLMPFVLVDRYIVPAAPRVLAGALYQSGFTQTRAVYQLWNRWFRPSQARLGGLPPDILLLSGLVIHSAKLFEAIRDAYSLGDRRPLIIVGGPTEYHDPYRHFNQGPAMPDVVCTGEVYVLLELLHRLQEFRVQGESFRTAFGRACRAGALESVAGLVYRDPSSSPEQPVLVDTGLQRLVEHLDELPDETVGLRLLEPPHGGRGLAPAPLSDKQVGRYCLMCSVMLTQGCKFHCPYCPISAVNQRTFRHRSPENIVRQFQTVYQAFGIDHFFGADDNFFNRRDTAEQILTALASSCTHQGEPLGRRMHWGTEATQLDTLKNRDLLPLARRAGMNGLWFGIEDLTAGFINKGHTPERIRELFRLMHQNKIAPMAMLMYHQNQPFFSRGTLQGITNQIDFLRRAGAISVQVTVHIPALGTGEFDETFQSGRVLRTLGNDPVPYTVYDGNHVIVAGGKPLWRRQLELLGAYAAFYNPLNLFRAMRGDGSPLRKKRMGVQFLGFLGTLWTAWKILPTVWRLLMRKHRFHEGPPPLSTVPVRQVAGSFPRVPSHVLPPPPEVRSAA
jgi:radical SAM superfamily enzyme YgiQ (UPF0313 family)